MSHPDSFIDRENENLQESDTLSSELPDRASDPEGESAGGASESLAALAKLNESEKLVATYRGLLDAAPDPMVVVHEGGDIAVLNLQAEKQFGYQRDELLGQQVKNIIPEGFEERLVADGQRSTVEALAQHMGSGIELAGRRKDGSEFPIEIMLSPLESPEGILVTAAIRDISVRKTAETHLAQMERRYRGLLEAAPDAMVVVNESGAIDLVNVQAEKQFGYRRDELLGQQVKNIIPEGFEERLVADGQRSTLEALAQHMGSGIELAGRRKDGSEFPIEIMLSPLESPEGILVTAAIRDISVRKTAETHLAQMERRYRGLLEAAPDAMVVVNESGAIDLVNVQAEKQFGYRRDELLGQQVKNIIPEGFEERLVADGQRSTLEALAQHMGSGIELAGRRKDGSEFPIEIMLSPLESPEGILVTAAIRDISVRKTAELLLLHSLDELNRSNQDFRLVFDAHPNPMWIFDEGDLSILAVNDAAIRHYGYTREEFLTMTACDLQSIEEGKPFLAEFTPLANQTLSLGSGGVFKHRKKSGEVIEIEAASSPITFNGRATVLGLVNDVTERNMLQARLLQLDKMESIGRLAGGIAHDINNLMGVVLGYGDLTVDNLDPTSPLFQNIQKMQASATQAASIVRQLLAFSRKQIQQPRILNINESLERVEDLLRRLIGEDIRLTISTESNLGMVRADPVQIEQIIMNLAVNARDAMPRGGQLTIKTTNVDLKLMDPRHELDCPTGPHVMLEVTDTGCGMDKKTKARMFEPFYTTKELGKGTGLGLAMVYGIVKQSLGSISVESQPGRGTTFRICLPQVEGTPQPNGTKQQFSEMPHGTETILLAEDAEPLREVVRQYLQGAGYNVLTAEDGEAALTVSLKHQEAIHLLLIDVVMPGLGGPQTAEKLRIARPGIRVLFMSGYTDEALGNHGILGNGTTLLEKPFTRVALLRKLRQLLDPVEESPL